eukprot:229099-Chlamydomonas_euryale.AAC.3
MVSRMGVDISSSRVDEPPSPQRLSTQPCHTSTRFRTHPHDDTRVVPCAVYDGPDGCLWGFIVSIFKDGEKLTSLHVGEWQAVLPVNRACLPVGCGDQPYSDAGTGALGVPQPLKGRWQEDTEHPTEGKQFEVWTARASPSQSGSAWTTKASQPRRATSRRSRAATLRSGSATSSPLGRTCAARSGPTAPRSSARSIATMRLAPCLSTTRGGERACRTEGGLSRRARQLAQPLLLRVKLRVCRR